MIDMCDVHLLACGIDNNQLEETLQMTELQECMESLPIDKEKLYKFKIDRRIECSEAGYPYSEARFADLIDYILYLEKKRFEMREAIEQLTITHLYDIGE